MNTGQKKAIGWKCLKFYGFDILSEVMRIWLV
jgi:hypothetical protein